MLAAVAVRDGPMFCLSLWSRAIHEHNANSLDTHTEFAFVFHSIYSRVQLLYFSQIPETI